MEASVQGGMASWKRFEAGGRESGFENGLKALQVAVVLWIKSDWGRRELRDHLEVMCSDFLTLMAGLAEVLEHPPSAPPSAPPSRPAFSLGEMEAITRAVVEAVATEGSEQAGGEGGRDGGRDGGWGESAFPAASQLVRVQCPELSVLYACRLTLASLINTSTSPKNGGTDALARALRPLLSTLPPLGGVAPKRLWPPLLRTCLALLQTIMRDQESNPGPEVPAPPLSPAQAAALMTCMAEVQVTHRREEFLGWEGKEGWKQTQRQVLAVALARAFVQERKEVVAWEERKGQGGAGGRKGGGREGQRAGRRESAMELLRGPPIF
jgi:hypothetical protein